MDRDTEAADLRRQVAATTANWSAAQSLSLSVDLIPASLRLRQLLAAVDRNRCLLYSGPALSHAIRRYENCWLPLFADNRDEAIIPPLDCAWIWYCHRLSPSAYASDCERLYGSLLGGPATPVPSDDAEDFRRTTQKLWQQRFPDEPFELDLSRTVDLAADPNQSRIKYDLRSAVDRQRSFYYQISESHMGDERYLRGAEQRYKGFLYLFKMTESEVFFVPTYDIDLMWHAHQLHSEAYARDTKAILGKVLDHDDTDSNNRSPAGHNLDQGFRQTSITWLESYGRVYERAGAMYRGDPPQTVDNWKIPPSTIDMVGISNSSTAVVQEASLDYEPVTIREEIQVHVSVLGARNIPSNEAGTLQVRVRLLRKCSAFELETPSVSISSSHRRHPAHARWNQRWSFLAELSTEGLCFEIIFMPSTLIGRMASGSEVVLGRAQLPWKRALESVTLSEDGWFSVERPQDPAAPYLFVSVSVTPPVLGPQLFHVVNSIATDDTGKMDLVGRSIAASRKGCWLTRTVLDHANREVFIVRLRYSDGQTMWYTRTPEADKCIHIHRGGWRYSGRNKAVIDSANIVASAKQIVTGNKTEHALSNERRWGFLGNSSHLIITRSSKTPIAVAPPILTLSGSLENKMKLVSGRKLQYEAKIETSVDEIGFVTVIRQDGSGSTYASALFNWRTGTMEVSPEESVILVLLLSSIISASVFDMEGSKAKLDGNPKPPDPEKSAKTLADEWGSVTMGGIRMGMPRQGMGRGLAFAAQNSGLVAVSLLGAAMMLGGGGCGAVGGGGGCGAGGCGGGGCGGGG